MSEPLRYGVLLSLLVVAGSPLPGQIPATAQEAGRVVEMDELVKELLRNNPAIRAAQYRVDAATKRPSQMSTLPEPKLSVSNFGVGHPLSRLRDSDFAYV